MDNIQLTLQKVNANRGQLTIEDYIEMCSLTLLDTMILLHNL